jgi:hypothetical protein
MSIGTQVNTDTDTMFACSWNTGEKLVSLSLREEHMLTLFGNMMLRKISGPQCKQVTREWNKLHHAKLHEWYFLCKILCG